MRESPFGFYYSWQDLKPVRPLFVTVLMAQIIGASLCYSITLLPQSFDNLWIGAALGTFPGYLLGLFVQLRISPNSVKENKVMVYRMGFVAFVFLMASLLLPKIGLIHAL